MSSSIFLKDAAKPIHYVCTILMHDNMITMTIRNYCLIGVAKINYSRLNILGVNIDEVIWGLSALIKLNHTRHVSCSRR